MKFRILLIVMVTIFLGNLLSVGITQINRKYGSSLHEELFSGKINQENYKKNPYQELERVIKTENIMEEANIFSEKYNRFVWFTFVMRILLGLILSYISTILIIKTLFKYQAKIQLNSVSGR